MQSRKRSLEHHEHSIGTGFGWSLVVQVGGQGREETGGDRHDPLVPALALGDEHPMLAGAQVPEPQPEHLAAA